MKAKRKAEVTAPLTHETRLYEQGYTRIGGIDEVGRGAVAGPLVACIVIMPQGVSIPRVNDSKQLTPKDRERLAAEIKAAALGFGTGWVGREYIDQRGMAAALEHAIKWAEYELNRFKSAIEKVYPDAVLIDGKPQRGGFRLDCHTEYIIKGDSASHSIAAASIIAKVERDKFMAEQHALYPAYGFNTHKGYGTRRHFEAIERFGLCPLHRASFLRKYTGSGGA